MSKHSVFVLTGVINKCVLYSSLNNINVQRRTISEIRFQNGRRKNFERRLNNNVITTNTYLSHTIILAYVTPGHDHVL